MRFVVRYKMMEKILDEKLNDIGKALFRTTATAKGFHTVAAWEDLSEETRQMYCNEALRREVQKELISRGIEGP